MKLTDLNTGDVFRFHGNPTSYKSLGNGWYCTLYSYLAAGNVKPHFDHDKRDVIKISAAKWTV